MDLIMFYFLLFLIYSVVGWMVEVISCSIKEKRLAMRGFLIGPYCPIYGFAALILIFLLKRYINDPLVMFMMALLVVTVIEYLTSYLLEKLFKIRWWDYSEQPFNVNGRISLVISLLFGILGLILMYYLNPHLINILKSINPQTLTIIGSILMIMIIIDAICSYIIISRLKMTIKNVHKDFTKIIDKKVWDIIKPNSIYQRRLLKAFPNFKISEPKKKNPKK